MEQGHKETKRNQSKPICTHPKISHIKINYEFQKDFCIKKAHVRFQQLDTKDLPFLLFLLNLLTKQLETEPNPNNLQL